jgi:hypothetical protein
MSFWSKFFRSGSEKSPTDGTGLMVELVRAYTALPSLRAEREFLLKHPELLSEEAEKTLATLAANQRVAGNREFLERRRSFLQRCRAVGLEKAFQEEEDKRPPAQPGEEQLVALIMPFLQARSISEAKALVKQHPELLGPEADAFLQKAGDDPRVVIMLESRRRLLARCRDIGIDAAFAEKESEQNSKNDWTARFSEGLRALLSASSPEEMERVLLKHPELLSPEADVLLEQFAHTQIGKERAATQRLLEVLRARRRTGSGQPTQPPAPSTPPPLPQPAPTPLEPDLAKVLEKPQFVEDPVFKTENYLATFGANLFQQLLAQSDGAVLAEAVMMLKETDPGMAVFRAAGVGFWAIDLEARLKHGVTGREEFISRVQHLPRRPPPEMAASTCEQHIMAKGVARIQVHHEYLGKGAAEICDLKTVGWYMTGSASAAAATGDKPSGGS